MSAAQLAQIGSNINTAPVCVGPFMIQSEVSGQSVTLVRSPYYYDKQDVHLDKIVIQYESSDHAAAAALETGDIQALDQVPSEELKNVEDNGFRVIGSLAFGGWRLGINLGNVNGALSPYSNTGTPIASSPQLRQAFEMAIDRKTLNRVVFRGTNVPGCTPLSPAAGEWYDATIQCTPYDPVQARKLVQQSGISNPTIQMLVGSDTQSALLGQFLQSEEQAIGINLVLTSLDPVTLNSRANAGNYQTFLVFAAQVKADPDWIYAQFLDGTGGLANLYGYANPSFVLDLYNSRTAVSEQARQTLYHDAQEHILADRRMIYLVHILNRAAVSSLRCGDPPGSVSAGRVRGLEGGDLDQRLWRRRLTLPGRRPRTGRRAEASRAVPPTAATPRGWTGRRECRAARSHASRHPE
jgi:peptide/nickel transport system substrate-binding protein